MCIQCGRCGFARPRKPGQSFVGKKFNLTNQIFVVKRTLTMELLVQKIVGRKIETQDFSSDDDVSAIIDSDSDILETIEKANIVEFLNDNSRV
jgi:hypothetical protein